MDIEGVAGHQAVDVAFTFKPKKVKSQKMLGRVSILGKCSALWILLAKNHTCLPKVPPVLPCIYPKNISHAHIHKVYKTTSIQ